VSGLCHERNAPKVRREGATQIEREAASRSELAHIRQHLEPGTVSDGKNLGGIFMIGHVLHGSGHRQIGIAL
jgi:hypothetical protein